MRAPVVFSRFSCPCRFGLVVLVVGLLLGSLPPLVDCREAFAGEPMPSATLSQGDWETALEAAVDGGDGTSLVSEALVGKPVRFVNQVVPLDGQVPVLGSFAVDGMVYAVTGEGTVELVAVAPSFLAGSLAVGSDGTEGEEASEPVVLEIPESVEHDGVAYSVTSIGPRTFVSCGADVVRIPASVASVDEAAFRGSSVGSVEVAEGNPNLASYEGVLYGADFSSLLLIPEGKKGVVRIHSNTSAITPEAFSHCASVTSVEVDAGGGTPSSGEQLNPLSEQDALICQGSLSAADASDGPTLTIHLSYPRMKLIEWNSHGVNASTSMLGTSDKLTYQLVNRGTGLKDFSKPGTRFYFWNPATSSTWSFALRGPATLTDYSFAGYSLDPEHKIPATAVDDTKDVELYTVFTPTKQDLTFDLQDGSAPLTYPNLATYGKALPVLPFEVPRSPCRTFLGFFDAPQGEDAVAYYDSKGIPTRIWDKLAGTVLYAHWEALSYAIRYDLNGGVSEGDLPSSYRCDVETVIPAVTKRGYTFMGWRGDGLVANDDLTASIPVGQHGDKQLVAEFAGPNAYALTYELNGGGLPEGAPSEYLYGKPVEVPAAQRDGYLFEGWTIAGEEAPPRKPFVLDGDRVGDVRLAAHWSPIEFPVRFEAVCPPDGGEPSDPSLGEVVLTVESPDYAVPAVSLGGYLLIGWVSKEKPAYEGLVSLEEGGFILHPRALKADLVDLESGKVVLVARWTAIVSVDAPTSATFFADRALQGQGSREAQVEGMLGQSQASTEGKVALRVAGLECRTAAGAEGVLSGGTGGVLSVYPAERLLSAEEAQASEGASARPVNAVDFALGDVVLEQGFEGKGFVIPAGGQLVLGYRLNLAETGARLDFSKLPQTAGDMLPPASIAYTFAVVE